MWWRAGRIRAARADACPVRARSLSVRALGLRIVSVLAGAGVGLGASSTAHAAGPLGSNGAPITTSAYSIDLYQGAVSAGNRVMGLGGAYVALAEDVDGDLQNPAAPAVRPFFSIDHFDYWLGLGLTFPASLSKIDFFNS